MMSRLTRTLTRALTETVIAVMVHTTNDQDTDLVVEDVTRIGWARKPGANLKSHSP